MNSKPTQQIKHAIVLFYNRRHHPLIIQWLKRVYNCRVTSVAVQLGDIKEEENIAREARQAGVDDHLYIDAREEFAENFLLPAIKAHAVYEDKYFLSAALARPMLAQKLVEIAEQQGADLIVHGFRGNDQVRLDMAVSALSTISCLGVLRKWDVTIKHIESYAEENRIPQQPGTNNPYSTSENIWGKSTECGPLELPSLPPPREIFTWVVPPEQAPDEPGTLTIGFENGRPITINGLPLSLKDILLELNEKAARHGIGITDMVEDGMVGLKSRAIYEHPGALCLIQAHQDLERFVCNRHENLFKKHIELKWAEMVYAGLWYDPLMRHLNRFIDSMNERVSGTVTLKLYKGTLSIEARNSTNSIYNTRQAIYNFGDNFGQEDAAGYGRVYNRHTLASYKKIKNKENNQMQIKHLLMSKPTYFSIDYSINPWMDVNNPVDPVKAHEQWSHLCEVLKKLGVQISLIEPVKGLPDMTFTGDCGMVHGNKFIRSNFRYRERQGEAEIFAKWIENQGYEVFRLPEHIYFEGLGDVVYYGNDIIFGYGPRSDQAAVEEVKRIFPDLHVRGELYIKDPAFFHVALAVAFIAEDTLLYYPPAFDKQSLEFITKNFKIALPVSELDAKEFFVCNNIPIENKLLMDNCTAELEAQLNKIGIEVIKCDMSEFKKSGGSLRCLILKL